MKWKLISFKIKRWKDFLPLSTQDWMWLWGVLKISRFIESTRTQRETMTMRKGGDCGSEKERGKLPRLGCLFWALLVPLSLYVAWMTGGIDWLTVFVWKLRDGSSSRAHTFVPWTEISNCENFSWHWRQNCFLHFQELIERKIWRIISGDSCKSNYMWRFLKENIRWPCKFREEERKERTRRKSVKRMKRTRKIN